MNADWKVLPAMGIKIPPNFPVEAYLKVKSNLEIVPSNKRISFNLAWAGIAFRYRASYEYGEQFTNSIIKYTGAPPPEERYKQEKYLLGFFVNAISTLECFFFSTYCIAAIVKPNEFPMKVEDDLKVYPWTVVKKFNENYKSCNLTKKQSKCCDDVICKEMYSMRDVFSHRGLPTRTFYHGGARDGIATMPKNPKAPSDQWLSDFRLDDQMTSSYITWLSATLEELIEATNSFCKEKF